MRVSILPQRLNISRPHGRDNHLHAKLSALVSPRNGDMSAKGNSGSMITKSPAGPQELLARLAPVYGPLNWKQRRDPVSELVVTILSQHTSDANAERAFGQLVDAFGSMEAVADAEIGAIANCIRSGGLAQQKAPRIKTALNRIIQERGSLNLDFLRELPLAEAKAWLKALPGVGPKTAAVVLCFSFGMPAMPVDTHVHRVARRLGLIGGKVTADQAHDLLESVVAPEDVYRFHVYLITHGRQVCRSQRPLCESCVLAGICPTGLERLGVATPKRH